MDEWVANHVVIPMTIGWLIGVCVVAARMIIEDRR